MGCCGCAYDTGLGELASVPLQALEQPLLARKITQNAAHTGRILDGGQHDMR